jgi:hypothetical protein
MTIAVAALHCFEEPRGSKASKSGSVDGEVVFEHSLPLLINDVIAEFCYERIESSSCPC